MDNNPNHNQNAKFNHKEEEILSQCLNDVRHLHDIAQKDAAKKLRIHVEGIARQLSAEKFTQYMNDLNRRIMSLVNSSIVNEKMGAIHIIDELIDVPYEENDTKIIRFVNYLRMVFQQSTESELDLLKAAAKAMGHIARGGTMTADLVEFEIKRSLEWLDPKEQRTVGHRHAAILVLREVAENNSTLFNLYVEPFMEQIWTTQKDSKPIIREDSTKCLRACLNLIAKRDHKWSSRWHNVMFQKIQQILTNAESSPEAIHGALLAVGELLENSDDFLLARFRDLCVLILGFRNYRDTLVRETVVSLLPRLASYCPEVFVQNYLDDAINHMIETLHSNHTDRSGGYIALGKMAVAVGDKIVPKLSNIIPLIKDGLNSRSGKGFQQHALTCISMLARAVKQELTTYLMKDLVDQMFDAGLTNVLVESLTELTLHIPSLLPAVQGRLLKIISDLLIGGRQIAGLVDSTNPARRSSVQILNMYMNNAPLISNLTHTRNTSLKPRLSKISLSESDRQSILLALKTLGTFDFRRHNLVDFLRNCVLHYLNHSDATIRKQAVQTSSRLLVHSLSEEIPIHLVGRIAPQHDVVYVVHEVLHILLSMCISDSASSIRSTVLNSLVPKFDKFLAEPLNVQSILIAMNDAIFDVRGEAIRILGRLACSYPAVIMAPLRQILVQLLRTLKNSDCVQTQEENAQLLDLLIATSGNIIEPYVDAILKALLPLLYDTNTNTIVASYALKILGTLSVLSGKKFDQYHNDLLKVIIRDLQSPNTGVNKEVALHALTQITAGTANVVTPYEKYPKLLPTILRILRGERGLKGRVGWPIRREVMSSLGMLGALDPYQNKINQVKIHNNDNKNLTSPSNNNNNVAVMLSASSKDYFPNVAITALLTMLKEPGLSQYHNKVVQALMFIFNVLGKKCVKFLSNVIPIFIDIMYKYANDESMHAELLRSLTVIVTIAGDDIGPYVSDILASINSSWNNHKLLMSHILILLRNISISLKDEFAVHLPKLIPSLLSIFQDDTSHLGELSCQILLTLEIFGSALNSYAHLVLPAVLSLIENKQTINNVRVAGLATISRLAKKLNITIYASRIVQLVVNIMNIDNIDSTSITTTTTVNNLTSLEQAAMKALCSIAYTMSVDYAVYISVVKRVLSKRRILHNTYEAIVLAIVRNGQITKNDIHGDTDLYQWLTTSSSQSDLKTLIQTDNNPITNTSGQHLGMDATAQTTLQKAWRASQLSTKDDWLEWHRTFSIALLSFSPSPALRSCSMLAQKYTPLARQLFNAAFLSCWSQLDDQYQDDLVTSILVAFDAKHIPAQILQTLLNLAEFMEHENAPLPIDSSRLASLAEKCHAFAKSLHYKEAEFEISPKSTFEALISINNQLNQPEAAIGVLTYAQQTHSLEVKESWHEKLQRWEDALEAYERKQLREPNNVEITLGRMRCLRSLGEWERLSDLSHALWNNEDHIDLRQSIASLAAYGAWQLGRWDEMQQYVKEMSGEDALGSFLRAVLSTHLNEFVNAQQHIDRTRELLDSELTALVGESYNRGYSLVVQLQQLTELEEVIKYKQSMFDEEKQHIKKIWDRRLNGCQRNVDVWQQILAVRSIVLAPQESINTWLKFSSVCRKSGRMALSLKVLTTLLELPKGELNDENLNTTRHERRLSSSRVFSAVHPKVMFAYLKHLWSAGFGNEALRRLTGLVNSINADEENKSWNLSLDEIRQLKSKCYLKMGNWQLELAEDLDEQRISKVLEQYELATTLNPTSYKVWHAWAGMNYRIVSQKTLVSGTAEHITEKMKQPLISAINGFFRSIELAGDQGLQDVLRLLTLWFTHGGNIDVENALNNGFNRISIDTWLTVIPQIIARIDTRLMPVRRLVGELLQKIGKAHPQALIYSLTVAAKSATVSRKIAAQNVLDIMCEHSGHLVEEASLVSEELIRVAVLWHEMWHEALEEASRVWFGQRDFDSMWNVLEPMHQLMNDGPKTLREIAFIQAYGRDLEEAAE